MRKNFILLILVSLFFVTDVKAVTSINMLEDVQFSVNGQFYSLNSDGTRDSKGYSLVINDDVAYAIPSNTNWHYGTSGGSLVQCGMSFIEGNNYAVTYYFSMTDSSNYLHPSYSSYSNKLGIGTNYSNANLDFNYTSVSTGVEMLTIPNWSTPFGSEIGTFTIVFKANETGTCLNVAFSSSDKNTYANEVGFIGRHFQDLGAGTLTSSEVQTIIDNSINNALGGLESEQQETNDKLDDLNDSISSDSEDTSSSSCGIICKLKGIWEGITNLPNLILDGLGNLFTYLLVPSDDQFEELIEDSADLAENFGFVGQSYDFAVELLSTFRNYSSGYYNNYLTFPEFSIPATSLTPEVVFWEDTKVNFVNNELLNKSVGATTVISLIRTITSFFIIGWFVSWGFKEFYRVMSKSTAIDDGSDIASGMAQDVGERYNQESRLRYLDRKSKR